MKIWLLSPMGEAAEYFDGYDTSQGFVVAAETEDDARKYAENESGDESYTIFFNSEDSARREPNYKIWLNDKMTRCVELNPDNCPIGIVLRDFKAG